MIVNDSVTREAITRKQERDLLKFIKEDKHFCRYYDAIYILLNTGLRISEFCGLTISDLEFDQKRIKVDHQLQRTSQMQYVIQAPKTESGIRYVPMSEEVVACFRRILANRVAPKIEPMVDGYAGFCFSTRTISQWSPFIGRSTWNILLRNITRFTVFRCPK